VWIDRAERFSQDFGRRLDTVAALGREEIGLHQISEMPGVIVELTDDEITVREQSALKRQVVRKRNNHPLLEKNFLLIGPSAAKVGELESSTRQGANARDGCEELPRLSDAHFAAK
jgi:hypothetical protein